MLTVSAHMQDDGAEVEEIEMEVEDQEVGHMPHHVMSHDLVCCRRHHLVVHHGLLL